MSLSILLFPLSMSAQYEIDSTVVRPRGYAESMVRKAAENFAGLPEGLCVADDLHPDNGM